MGTLEEARSIFSKDLYATELSGIEIDEIGKDYAKCSMKLTEKHKNAYGGIMGGAIYTLADFAFAVASNYEKEQATVSLVGQSNFLSATKGSILYAQARLLKDGSRNSFFEVNVTDDLDKLIAVVSFTGAHVPFK
ncbi:PaaI family thioesterase [Butyrivibrio sp. VCB2006]|uniref:PaaI family thioesterase n=1 Tax=Butyrivibrio sp. VCB2006 TaxID=1280679 RepID=UPI000415B610|nr:PaaI family thioesterase [Butyrivibrio sp. VCB2006]